MGVRVELKTLGFHQTVKPEARRFSSLHEQFGYLYFLFYWCLQWAPAGQQDYIRVPESAAQQTSHWCVKLSNKGFRCELCTCRDKLILLHKRATHSAWFLMHASAGFYLVYVSCKIPTNPFTHAACFHMKLKTYNWWAVIFKLMQQLLKITQPFCMSAVES